MFFSSSTNDRPNKKIKPLRGVALLVSEYEELANRYGTQVFNVEKLRQRYQKALQRGIRERDFLEVEYEVLKEYLAKTEQEAALKKQNLTKAAAAAERKQPPKETPATDKIIEKFEKKYRIYKQVQIHPRADKELQYLLGAMIEFYEQYLNPLMQTVRYIHDKTYMQQVYEVEELFYNLGYYKSANRLPKIFSEYKYKIEQLAETEEVLIEKAGLQVFKAVIHFLKKIKKLVQWLKATLPPLAEEGEEKTKAAASVHREFYVTFKLRRLVVQRFVEELSSRCNEITTNFRLEEF